MNYAMLKQSVFATYLREYGKGAFCSPLSFSADPVGRAIIFLDVYDFALMSAVNEAPVLSDRGTSLGPAWHGAARDWAPRKEDSPRIGGIDR